MDVGSLSEIASACVALAALGAVGYEYRHTRRQRRLELAQELAHQLELNDVLRFATTSLDWAVGLVPIPEEWRGVVGKPAIKPDLRAMRAALTPQFPSALQKDPVGLMYRHAFVALFNHFERAKELKDKNAVLADDLGAFGWVAAELVDWSYAPFGSAELFFMGAIRGWYGRTGLEEFVRELAARFPKETRHTHVMATVSVACGGEEIDPKSARNLRAAQAGRIIAELGFNLITDGGSGTMGIVAKHYCSVANRAGRSIGVFPGLAGFDDVVVDKLIKDDVEAKYARMPWIEVPIYAQAQGKGPEGRESRDIISMRSADIVVVLAGGKETQAELEIALGLERPIIAYLAGNDRVGAYDQRWFQDKKVTTVRGGPAFRLALKQKISELRTKSEGVRG